MLTESQINMLQKKDETVIFDNALLNSFIVFWIYICKKIIFSLVSVKVWAFIGVTWVSTYLTINGYINGANFAAIMCTMITTILAAREVAKIGYNAVTDKMTTNNPIVNNVSNAAESLKNKILNEVGDEIPD